MSTIDSSKYNETFTGEAKEQLTDMNRLLLALEKDPENTDVLNDFFRVVHTLKGTSAILGHSQISEVSHLVEDILDEVRSKNISFDTNLFNLLFEGVDTLEAMVGEVTKEKKQVDGAKIITKLKDVSIQKGEKQASKNNVVGEMLSVNELISTLSPDEKKVIESEFKRKSEVFLVSITFDQKCKLIEGRAFQIFRDLGESVSLIRSIPEKDDIGRHEGENAFQILLASSKKEDEIEDIIHQTPDLKIVVVEPITSLSIASEKKQKNVAAKAGLGTGETIRVNVSLLDALLNLVGENMINNIQINQIASEFKHKGLKNALKTSNRLTEELQHYVLQMRMVPMDQIFRRFPRMVRDMAKEGDKNIDLSIEGNDIEIDRGLLDEIGDSLVHLLRNAVDHGIEPSSDRVKHGKDETGTIKLSAHREQSYIVIEISDDGKGIDMDKLTKAAVKKGIVTEKDVEEMNFDERLSLIFLPGVSTAEKITEVSGRGVGLDVVQNEITSLGGTVSIESEVGKGTNVTIKLPPTMTIIKALMVRIGDERYALPLENVAETVKISPKEIHTINNTGMFKLREDVLPLFDLNHVFGDTRTGNDKDLSAVIVEKDAIRVGLIVDEFIDQQEIVVKTIGKQLRKSKYFSGATILGDGAVAMIIDVGAFT